MPSTYQNYLTLALILALTQIRARQQFKFSNLLVWTKEGRYLQDVNIALGRSIANKYIFKVKFDSAYRLPNIMYKLDSSKICIHVTQRNNVMVALRRISNPTSLIYNLLHSILCRKRWLSTYRYVYEPVSGSLPKFSISLQHWSCALMCSSIFFICATLTASS